MAKTIADYYHANDGSTGAIPLARKAVAELTIDTITSDREGCARAILSRYALPLILLDGEAEASVVGGDGVPSIIVHLPVKPADRIDELLGRVDDEWVSTPVHLCYNDGQISYKIRAGEPAFAKEEVRHSLEMVRQQEIEPRNRAVIRENEKLERAIYEAIDERVNETNAAKRLKQQVKEALTH